MKHLVPLAAALLTASLASAQTTQMNLIVGTTSSTAYIAGSSLHRMAVSADGSIYAVMKLGSPLVIFKSTDGGSTWKQVASDATGGNPTGQAIVSDPGCNLMHVGFHARGGANKEAPHYRVLDTTTDQWVGPATIVHNLATPTQDWRLADIEVTQKGTVVVAFKSPSSAPTGFKNSAGYIAVKKAGQTAFSAPIQVSTGGNGSGLRNQLHAIGEVVHMAYRYSSGGHNATYRAYDTEAMAFVGPQVVIDGPKATPAAKDLTNYFTMAVDDFDRIYVMYGVGDTGTTNDGQYKLAWADAPYTTWTKLKVADDPMIKGKATTKHFSVVHTTGDDIHVIYAKKSPPDSLDKLYTRQLVNGALTPEKLLLTRPANTFHTIWGYRAQQSNTGFVAFIHDESPASRRNMWYLNNSGKAGRTRILGKRCKGNRASLPLLSTNRMPEAGRFIPPFNMTMGKLPANSAGTLFVGLSCRSTPLDLGVIGAPGCEVLTDPLITFSGFSTDAQGGAAVRVFMGPQFAGVVLNFEAAVLAPGANAAGLLVTNGLMINP